MPQFSCTIEFSLETRIEPDGIRFDNYTSSEIEDFEDNSYFRDTDVEADGGSITFTVEADTEEEATEKAVEVLSEGMEFEDDNGFTWITASVTTEVERIVIPMTLDRAKDIVKTWLDGRDEEDDLSEAVDFLLGEFDRLGSKIQELGTEIGTLSQSLRDAELKVAELAGELDRLKNGPDGSEAPTEAVA